MRKDSKAVDIQSKARLPDEAQSFDSRRRREFSAGPEGVDGRGGGGSAPETGALRVGV